MLINTHPVHTFSSKKNTINVGCGLYRFAKAWSVIGTYMYMYINKISLKTNDVESCLLLSKNQPVVFNTFNYLFLDKTIGFCILLGRERHHGVCRQRVDCSGMVKSFVIIILIIIQSIYKALLTPLPAHHTQRPMPRSPCWWAVRFTCINAASPKMHTSLHNARHRVIYENAQWNCPPVWRIQDFSADDVRWNGLILHLWTSHVEPKSTDDTQAYIRMDCKTYKRGNPVSALGVGGNGPWKRHLKPTPWSGLQDLCVWRLA